MPSLPGAYANRGCYSSSGGHSENSGLSRAALAGAAGSSCILQIFGPTGMVLRRPKSRCRIGVPSACAISTLNPPGVRASILNSLGLALIRPILILIWPLCSGKLT